MYIMVQKMNQHNLAIFGYYNSNILENWRYICCTDARRQREAGTSRIQNSGAALKPF
jgi:hypothetical protein